MIFLWPLCLLAIVKGSVLQPNTNQDGVFELLILHNNDMHARFEQTSQLSGVCTTAHREAGKCYGGFPRVATVVKEARQKAAAGTGPPVLYLNAGDTYTGTAWFTIYKWKIAAEFINALQPDAVALGNDDVDEKLSDFLNSMNSHMISSNVLLDAKAKIEKSVVFDVNGVKVGVVGFLTPDNKVLKGTTTVEYIDEVLAIQEEAKKLKDTGINIIIALGHSDNTHNIEIARSVEDIDLVISGQKNFFYWNGQSTHADDVLNGDVVVVQSSGRKVPVIKSYAYNKYLGSLRLIFDSNGELLNSYSESILLDNTVAQDKEILEVLAKNSDKVMVVNDVTVGTTAVVLDGETCQAAECNLGNLIADAIIYFYALRFEEDNWTDAPLALVPSGIISSSIAPADRPASIFRGDLLAALPSDSSLVTVTMDGTTLLRVLEESVAEFHPNNTSNDVFFQYSGVRVVFDFSAEPGSRVKSADVRCWSCYVPEFYTIDDWRTYKVLMPGYLIENESRFNFLQSLTVEDLGYDAVACLAEYIGLRSPVYPEVAERVVLENLDQLPDIPDPDPTTPEPDPVDPVDPVDPEPAPIEDSASMIVWTISSIIVSLLNILVS